MKANELRINNYYSQFGNIHQASWNTIKDLESAPEDQLWCKPIPLTEKWHNKFGIKKNWFDSFVYRISEHKTIEFSGDYVFIRDFDKDIESPSMEDNLCTLWNKDIRRRDMYVHEWQNLWFALTGSELTLNDTP